jgi:hypothetical protein
VNKMYLAVSFIYNAQLMASCYQQVIGFIYVPHRIIRQVIIFHTTTSRIVRSCLLMMDRGKINCELWITSLWVRFRNSCSYAWDSFKSFDSQVHSPSMNKPSSFIAYYNKVLGRIMRRITAAPYLVLLVIVLVD